MNCDHLERLLFAQPRKNGWHSPSKHRLASTWRSYEQNVVTTSRSNFERALCALLPHHVGEVCGLFARLRLGAVFTSLSECAVTELAYEIAERERRGQVECADAGCLRHIRRRKHQRGSTNAQGVPCDRQSATHRSECSIESELSHEYSLCDGVRSKLSGGDENADCDRQIERRPFFANICRR